MMSRLALFFFLGLNTVLVGQDLSKYIDQEKLSIDLVLNGNRLGQAVASAYSPDDPNGYIEQGLKKLEESPKEALEQFQRVVTMIPESEVGYYFVGMAYIAMHRYRDARREIDRCLKINPTFAAGQIALGDLEVYAGNFAAAKSSFQKASAFDPNSILPHLRLGDLSLAKREFGNARRHYNHCLTIDSASIDAHCKLGMLKIMQLQPNNAIEYFDKVIAIDSTYTAAYIWRGFIYLSKNKGELCLKDWNTLVTQKPNETLFYALRGFLLLELKRLDEAYDDLHKSVILDPVNEARHRWTGSEKDKKLEIYNAIAYLSRNQFKYDSVTFHYYKRGVCHLLMEDYAQATNMFERAIKKSTENAAGYYLRALCREFEWGTQKAAPDYEKSIALDSTISDPYLKLGIYHYDQGDFRKAIRDFERLAELEPENAVGYRYMGIIQAEQNDCESALKSFDRYIGLDSTDNDIYFNCGYCKMQLQKFSEAKLDFKRVLKKKKHDLQARYLLANLELATGDTTQALVELDTLTKLFYDHWESFHLKAQLYYLKKDYKAAIFNFSQAIQYNKTNIDLVLHRGIIYYQMNFLDLALQDMDQVISQNPKSGLAYYQRSLIYSRKGNEKAASKDLNQAQRLGYLPEH